MATEEITCNSSTALDADLASSNSSLSNFIQHKKPSLSKLLVCLFAAYGLLRSFRPIIPFLNTFLEYTKNISKTEIMSDLKLWELYGSFGMWIFVALFTNQIGHKGVVVFGALSRVSSHFAFLFGISLWDYRAAYLLYGVATGTDIVFHTYAYRLLDKSLFQKITGLTRSSGQIGGILGSLFGQLIKSQANASYETIFIITITVLFAATIVAMILPKEPRVSKIESNMTYIGSGTMCPKSTDTQVFSTKNDADTLSSSHLTIDFHSPLPTRKNIISRAFISVVSFFKEKLKIFNLVFSSGDSSLWSMLLMINWCLFALGYFVSYQLFTQATEEMYGAKDKYSLNGYYDAFGKAAGALGSIAPSIISLFFDHKHPMIISYMLLVIDSVCLLVMSAGSIWVVFAFNGILMFVLYYGISLMSSSLAKCIDRAYLALAFGTVSVFAQVPTTIIENLFRMDALKIHNIRQRTFIFGCIGCSFVAIAGVLCMYKLFITRRKNLEETVS